jgi:hypothetical protein
MDVIAKLEEVGLTINRQGKDYLSVRSRADTKPIRLKGLIYEQAFDAANLTLESTRPVPERGLEMATAMGLSAPNKAEQAADARRRFSDEIAKRARYNHKRYPPSDLLIDKQPEMAAVLTEHTSITDAATSHENPIALTLYANLNLAGEPDSSLNGWLPNLEPYIKPLSQADQPTVASTTHHRKRCSDNNASDNESHKTAHQNWWQKYKDEYDRFRTATIDRFRAIIAAIQRGHDCASEAKQQAQRASDRLVSTSRSLERTNQAINPLNITCSDKNLGQSRR